MDKSLDEIIASRPRPPRRTSSTRRGPSTARAQILGAAPRIPATTAPQQPADKIIVSNLPLDVNEAQIKELFHQTVGPLREVTLHYDAAGRSKGVAHVHFHRKGDASKAYAQYNNRLIDGKRPMRIEIVVDPARPVPASLASRVGGPVDSVPRGAPRGRGRGRVPRGGGGGAGGGRRNERPMKSVADLDAEMEDYTSGANAEEAAAAAAV